MDRKNLVIIASVFAAGIAIGLLGSTLFSPSGRSEVARITSTEPTGTVVYLTNAISTYRNNTYGFALDYPYELTVDEYDEGDGDRTIVFRKGLEEVGFQIFITPLSGVPFSKEVIELSHPRADTGSITATTVGSSTPAFALAGRAPLLGPSREIWFAHNGYVFQVTTYPELANWLADIFRTWQFTD